MKASGQVEAKAVQKDVFISYSRKDKDFVRRLHDNLVERDRNVWVDWEGIPPTAEWLTEIKSSIDNTRVFLFVISPDSVKSETCRTELEHAAENGKRIVPVVWRDAPNEIIPDTLKKLNWIFLRVEDDFESGIQTIIEALETDLDWLRLHTRLLVRSLEWDNADRNKSFVLHGSELEEAESARDQTVGKEPSLVKTQTEYITASRQAATKTLRNIIGGIGLAFLIAVGLAALAYWQYQVSEKRLKTALSRQLASESRLQSPFDLSAAMLLAAQSIMFDDTLEACRILFERVEDAKRMRILDDRTAPESVLYSADGKVLASARLDGNVVLWDLATATEITLLSVPGRKLRPLALSSQGKRIAVEIVGVGVAIFESTKGTTPQTVVLSNPQYATIAPDGTTLAVEDDRARIHIWKSAEEESVSNVISDPRIEQCYERVSNDGGIRGHLGRLSFTRDSDSLTWVCPGSHISWNLTTRTLSESGSINGLGLGPEWEGQGEVSLAKSIRRVAHDVENSRIAFVRHDGSISLYRFGDYRLLGHLEDNVNINQDVFITFSRTGRRLISHSGSTLLVWDVAGRRVIARYGFPEASHISINADGTVLAIVLNRPPRLVLFDLRPVGRVTGPFPNEKLKFKKAFLADGSEIKVYGATKALNLKDLIELKSGPANYNPASKILAIGRGDQIELWDLNSRTRKTSLLGRAPNGDKLFASGLGFNPTGNILFVGYQGGQIDLWHVPSEKLIARKKIPDYVKNITFWSEDGSFHAADAWDGRYSWTVDETVSRKILCNTVGRNLSENEWRDYVGPEVEYQKTCSGFSTTLQP